MTNDSVRGNLFDVKLMVKDLLLSYLVTIILLFAVSVIATYLSLPDAVVQVAIVVISCLCVFLCGYLSAKHRKKQGLMTGAAAGLLYAFVLYIIGSILLQQFLFSTVVFITMGIYIACGAIGGIFGINSKSKKTKKKK